jgi:GNAT superfamily N-acetyltransferase
VEVRIAAIAAADTLAVRRPVLRPGRAPEDARYAGDDDAETLHLGAFVDGRLVGVATIIRQPPAGEDDPDAWRVRGMATLPDHRGGGLGARLLDGLLEHARRSGGRSVWCTARIDAVSLYRRAGFEPEGAPFEIPGIGQHLVLRKSLASPDGGY